MSAEHWYYALFKRTPCDRSIVRTSLSWQPLGYQASKPLERVEATVLLRREPQERLAPATLSYGYNKERAPWAFPFSCGAHTIIMKPSHLHCIRIALLRGMPTSWLLCFCSHSPSHCPDKKATQRLANRGCWVAIASAITVSVYVSLMLKATNHSPPSWPLTNTYLDGPLSDGDMESSILHYTAALAQLRSFSHKLNNQTNKSKVVRQHEGSNLCPANASF